MVKEIVRKFKDEPSSGMFKVKYRENILLQRFWASTKKLYSIKMKTPSVVVMISLKDLTLTSNQQLLKIY
jgi:hypothetical protein